MRPTADPYIFANYGSHLRKTLSDPGMGGPSGPTDQKQMLADVCMQQSQNTNIQMHNRNPTKR